MVGESSIDMAALYSTQKQPRRMPVPSPIETIEGLDIIDTISDNDGHSYPVALFKEFNLFESTASHNVQQSIRYLSATDGEVRTSNEGDKYRFAPNRRFLVESGGRRLYTAIDLERGSVAAALWLHEVQADENDVDIYDVFSEHVSRCADSTINPDAAGTLAVRVYGDYRARGIGKGIVNLALPEYMDTWKNCSGVGIRISRNDGTAALFFEKHTPFAHLPGISPQESVIYMYVDRELVGASSNHQ